MKTRMEKWASYRERIAKTPEEKFKKKPHYLAVSQEEVNSLNEKALATGAVLIPSLPVKRPIVFKEAKLRGKIALGAKIFLAVLCFVLLVLLWIFWIKG